MTCPEDETHGASSTLNVSTKFKYPRESRFIEGLREGINAGKLRLEEGHLIEVELEPGGYDGKGAVIISAADPDEFIVAGAIKDPDRFARRIRVAAWALFEEKIYGRFIIEHDRKTGIVTIKRDTTFYR